MTSGYRSTRKIASGQLGSVRGACALGLWILLCGWLAGTAGGQPLAAGDPVTLRILQFGVGDRARPGDWVGMQVELTDSSTQTRQVVLEYGVTDVDGDTAAYQTVLPLGGEKKTTWLYARLPSSLTAGQAQRLSVYGTVEGSRGQREAGIAARGTRRGELKFAVPPLLMPRVGSLGIIGR